MPKTIAMLVLFSLLLCACSEYATPGALASTSSANGGGAVAELVEAPTPDLELGARIAAATAAAAASTSSAYATRDASDAQATMRAAGYTSTAVVAQAQATGTAQVVGSTQTAIPIQQTQAALALTAVGATAVSVRATSAYSEGLMFATATRAALSRQIVTENEGADRGKKFWDGALYLTLAACAVFWGLVLLVLWNLRGVPRQWALVRIERMKIVNTRNGTYLLGQGAGEGKGGETPPLPPAAIVNNDGTQTPIPMDDADVAEAEDAESADVQAPQPLTPKDTMLKFLDAAWAYQQRHPDWPKDKIPRYSRYKDEGMPGFDTGEKWHKARSLFGPALVGDGNDGTRVGPQWGSVSALYNAVQKGNVPPAPSP